jgi:hypothetical protein
VENETTEKDPKREDEAEAEVESPLRARARHPFLKIGLLVVGLGIAAYLAKMSPHEQHVRVVVGDQRWMVKAVELSYLAEDGDIARSARFNYANGEAPRVIAHEPELPDGPYRLKIEVDTREGRRAVERQVTLGGGSTQVDISSAIAPEDRKAP